METADKKVITIECTVNAPAEKVWDYWSKPEHITHWSNASEEWHTPRVENDLRVGGGFLSRMEAKDGSMGFDFAGTYDTVELHKRIEYTLGDNRKVKVEFEGEGNTTRVVESFETEQTHPVEMQQAGWQSILDNFKKYTEDHS